MLRGVYRMFDLSVVTPRSEIDFSVALLGLNWYREKDPRTPLGLALIAAYAKEHLQFMAGYDLTIINEDVRSNLSDVLHHILEVNPKVLGIGVYVWNVEAAKEMITGLRALGYSGKIVLGGPEISYGDDGLKEEFSEADYFVKGDGEKAFAQVIKHEASLLDNLPQGVFTHSDTDFAGSATVSYSEIISPFLDDAYLEELIGVTELGFTRWQSQRGCLYRCSFCAFPNGYDAFKEQDLESIEQELKVFKRKGVKEVAVLDPIFFVHKERAKKILRLIQRICPEILFEIQTKLEHLDEELMQLISQLNVFLECGVQTLDPIVQKEIKRGNSKKRMIERMKKLNEHEIEFDAHLIYGLPKQTIQSLQNDYTLLSKYTADIKLFPLIRLKGTGLDVNIEENNSDDFVFSPLFPKQVILTTWMSSEDIWKIKSGNMLSDGFFRNGKE